MRKAPERDPAPAGVPDPVEIRTYTFLTPVFGGGVEVNAHNKPFDPVTPIRVASVRGQLRFWWRACNPRSCATVAELHEAESEVFGSTDRASALSIFVASQPSRPVPFRVLEGRFGAVRGLQPLAYGAFPLRDSGGENHGVLHKYNGQWKLNYRFGTEAVRRDVEAALWAWAHFGGLGGRTRRGFGAIAQTSPGLPSIAQGWTDFVSGIEVPWPHLRQDRNLWVRTTNGTFRDGVEAQKMLLGKLQGLRQVPVGRKNTPDFEDGRRHPGRSYWPEPDAIRRATRRHERKHAKRVTTPDKYPRATFGTPIIFHFKDQGDPDDATLQPRGAGRLASPLLLRPHQRPDGAVEAMALVLGHAEPPEGYEISWRGGSRRVAVHLEPDEAVNMGVGGRPTPLQKQNQVFVDPLERYLEEIQ